MSNMPERIWMREAPWNGNGAIEETDGGDPVAFEYIHAAKFDRLLEVVMDAYHEGWKDGLAAFDDESRAPSREDEVRGWMASDVRERVKVLAQHEARNQEESATRKEASDDQ